MGMDMAQPRAKTAYISVTLSLDFYTILHNISEASS